VAGHSATSQGTQSYGYDALGRTMTDTSRSGAAITFGYSGAGNTVATDRTSTYTFDPTDNVIGMGQATAGGGTVAGSGELAFVDQHTDVVGDLAANVTTLAGSTTYDPLGNVLATNNQPGQLGYQSGWTDRATGKVNMAARWYNPATGQFMNKDTVSNNPVPNAAEANPFAYVDDNPMTGTDPTGHGWFSSAMSWVGNHIVKPAARVVNRVVIKPLVKLASAVNRVAIQPLVHFAVTAVHKVADVFHAGVTLVAHVATRVGRAVRTATKAAVHIVSTGYHAVTKMAKAAEHVAAKVVKTVATATVSFVQHHAPAIAAFAAGAATFIGCEALTAGVGSIGCAALAGAAGNAVSYGMSCGKSAEGCSAGGMIEAVGLGAISGAAGGALGELAGPLAGRLVSSALDGALPEVAVAGLVGAVGGAAGGAAAGAADYGISCGVTKSGCSWGGLASATAGGAETGALIGAVGGAGGAALRRSGGAPAAGVRENGAAAGCHSFVGGTAVLMADGSTKPISQVKVGDRVVNAVPGSTATQAHTVGQVIVTATDHDFVDVTVKATTAGRLKSAASRVGKAVVGVVAAAVAVSALATPAAAATTDGATGTTSTLTTTFHHPFYDITQAAFVDAQNLKPGDELQTTNGATTTITGVRRYHSATVTYDLTINDLHTYYVDAGTTPVLVHNCGNGAQTAVSDLRGAGQVAAKRNIAAAEVSIDGQDPYVLSSVSGDAERAGTVPSVGSPGNPQRFIPQVTGNNTRFSDTEFKLLNSIANRLGPSSDSITGTIHLHSELPMCDSCSSVVSQFRETFPNIDLNVTTG
jgi:RHS repeat-associated protein